MIKDIAIAVSWFVGGLIVGVIGQLLLGLIPCRSDEHARR